jgi:hypothetical protein
VTEVETRTELHARIEKAEHMIKQVSASDYLDRLQFTLGADWIHRVRSDKSKE